MRPLDGVRVLDLSRLLPGAYATLQLADLGADVVKIEDPRGGDGMRTLAAGRRASFFERLNRNKRSVTLDLRSPEAAAVLDALAARSDVTVESFRPSTARRLGVDGGSLRRRHPRLVCASISGFGQRGPYAERAAHDINYQALAGLLAGDPNHEPSMPEPLIADIGAAMQTAVGILAALVERARTGLGSLVDVSIHDAALSWSALPRTSDLAKACYTMYETADGGWLALGALEPKFWRGFCERIGRDDLVPLQNSAGEEGARVLSEVRAVMRSRTRAEWLAIFADADVCLSPVYATDAELREDPRVAAWNARRANAAPALGAHTDEVLEEAGIGADDRARLRAAGVI
jgi:alpha-methylacyl-CoA racemase